MADTKKLIDEIKSLTLMEAAEVAKTLKEELGLPDAAPMMAVAGAPAAGGGEAEEEKTEFDVELTSFGEKKINVIKVIREITGLGLGEAKALVEGAPKMIKEAASKEEAEEIKKKVEEAGGVATLK